jgi:serine/threonine protein kinase/Tfp pilus assembly protein PilF
MESERWHKVQQLYHSALEVEPGCRAKFVQKACEDDETLKQDLLSLLAQAETGADFLELPAIEIATRMVDGARPTPAAIGRYRVVRLLGEGGMGAVYEAEQDQPRRTVALKVIRPGFATAETLRRFQQELQALGRLQHPGIAQIYEASTADTGFGPQPFFAMELIRGRPLHEYTAAHRLSTRERLDLMARVCDAVQHAHQRGVIHRDLKPGNILVDETGQPKILDFGVARVTDSDGQMTRQTDLGQLVGTLAYMSPEQMLGDPLAVDIRSDVYALGVILYELLAGKLPHDVDRKPVHEAVEAIRDEEPATLGSIDRSYRGDIATIVAKAMEKDKARRYASAAALGEDIRRHLADEPIKARPANATYHLQKFARRHKAFVSGAAVVLLVLAVGAFGIVREAVRARRAEAVAEAVNGFLQNDLLAQASSSKQSSNAATKPDRDLKVRTALDRAAARIPGKFDRQPEVEAAIRDTIGRTYMDLGMPLEARKQLQRALELRRRVFGADNPMTLITMDHLASAVDYPEAEALYRQAFDMQRRSLGLTHADTLTSMLGLAETYAQQEKNAQADAMYGQILSLQRRVLGPEHPDTLKTMVSLAHVYFPEHKYAKAESVLLEIIDIRRRTLGPDHPETLKPMMGLAVAYYRQNKNAQAEATHQQVIEAQRRVLGPEHPDTLRTINNLGALYNDTGKPPQAEALFSQVLEISTRVNGPEHSLTLLFMSNLAKAYDMQGKYSQAVALETKTLETSRRVLGPEDPLTLVSLEELASLYRRRGNYLMEETYTVELLAARRHLLGQENPKTIAVAAGLALAYRLQGKFAKAEPLAREVLEFYRKKQPDGWQRFRAETLLGTSLAGQKKYAEAEPLLMEGYRGMLARRDAIAAEDRNHMDLAREWLVRLYKAWGKPEKAAELKKK